MDSVSHIIMLRIILFYSPTPILLTFCKRFLPIGRKGYSTSEPVYQLYQVSINLVHTERNSTVLMTISHICTFMGSTEYLNFLKLAINILNFTLAYISTVDKSW